MHRPLSLLANIRNFLLSSFIQTLNECIITTRSPKAAQLMTFCLVKIAL